MSRSRRSNACERWSLRGIGRDRLLILLTAALVVSASVAGVGIAVGTDDAPNRSDWERTADGTDPPTGLVTASTARAEFLSSRPDDRAGRSTATGDIDGDGVGDLLIGAPAHGDNGAVYLFYGPVEAADISLERADAVFLGPAPDSELGRSVETGDLNGNGHADVVIGAPGDETGGPGAGAVYVIGGSETPTGRYAVGANDTRVVGSPHDRAGTAVDARSVAGPATPSILIGAPGDDETHRGMAVVLSGDSVTGTVPVGNADAKVVGASAGDRAGEAVSWGGNWSDPGTGIALVGAPGHDGGGPNAGAVHVVEATSASGERSLADARATLEGPHPEAEAGTAVAVVGAVDGDGRSDLLVGAPGHHRRGADSGAAYVVSNGSATNDESRLAAVSTVTIYGEARGDRLGQSVSGGGDVNCDGLGDVAVGAPNHEASERATGAAYLLYGRSDGNVAAAKLVNENANTTGAGVAIGNVTGDGADDVLVGSPGNADSPRAAATLFAGACDARSDDAGRRSGGDGDSTAEETTRDDGGEAGDSQGTSPADRTGDGQEKGSDADRNDEPADVGGNETDPESGDDPSDSDEGAGEEPSDGDERTGDDGPDDGSDDGTAGDDGSAPDRGQTQGQDVTVTQTQCQSQSEGEQRQTQDQSVELSQNGQQVDGDGSGQANVQSIDVEQRQCQQQGDGVDNRQTQRQFLLIEFVSQRQAQRTGEGSEQTQIQTSTGTQTQSQNQTDSGQNQTQVQVFEITFVGTQFQPPGDGAQRQQQSQSVQIDQNQTQDQGNGVDQRQRQQQRVSVVYQGQEQVQGEGGQYQSQRQSANASQEQRQVQSASAQNQTQTERIETEQRQQQRQNATNEPTGQSHNQSVAVGQQQEQAQGDEQRQRQEQSVNGTQAERQNGTEGEQAQNQTQNTTLEQSQQQNRTAGGSTQTQDGTVAVDQSQTQTQTGNGGEQGQNESVAVDQSQNQTTTTSAANETAADTINDSNATETHQSTENETNASADTSEKDADAGTATDTENGTENESRATTEENGSSTVDRSKGSGPDPENGTEETDTTTSSAENETDDENGSVTTEGSSSDSSESLRNPTSTVRNGVARTARIAPRERPLGDTTSAEVGG